MKEEVRTGPNMIPIKATFVIVVQLLVLTSWVGVCRSAGISTDSDTCMSCHVAVTPGIVADWERSRHAQVSPQMGLQKGETEREVTGQSIPEDLAKNSVGCAECHTLNAESHKDTFDHNGFDVHVVVTPSDCALCHTVEREQYSQSLMGHAHFNLVKNPAYMDLAEAVNGVQTVKNLNITSQPSDPLTNADSCLACHGTAIEVGDAPVVRETSLGKMSFRQLKGWPNQGVGRVNPDGTEGSCTSCHTRHQFSVEMARRPYTCSQCHKGPDVPAFKVFEVSKHGNLSSSLEKEWDYKTLPWTVGKDFTAPTCAACHMSLLMNEDGKIIVQRTHQVNDRLPWRIFGLPYAHAHPKTPNTMMIRNNAGLSFPTELSGEPAAYFLIDAAEQARRRKTMQSVCSACHGPSWVEGHWSRFETAIRTTNEMTLGATQILLNAWARGLARGPSVKDSMFNEPIERMWTEQWLFFANSVRFSSAMGGADYGVFQNGRWNLAKNIREMKEWLDLRSKGTAAKPDKP